MKMKKKTVTNDFAKEKVKQYEMVQDQASYTVAIVMGVFILFMWIGFFAIQFQHKPEYELVAVGVDSAAVYSKPKTDGIMIFSGSYHYDMVNSVFEDYISPDDLVEMLTRRKSCDLWVDRNESEENLLVLGVECGDLKLVPAPPDDSIYQNKIAALVLAILGSIGFLAYIKSKMSQKKRRKEEELNRLNKKK
jgi:hypothetical protein